MLAALMLVLAEAFASRSYGPVLLGSNEDLTRVMPIRLHSNWETTERMIPSAQNVSWILTSPFTMDDIHDQKMDAFLDATKNVVVLPSVLGEISPRDLGSNVRDVSSVKDAFDIFRQEAALKKPVALMGWQDQSIERRQDLEDRGRIDLCCAYLTTTDSSGTTTTVRYDPPTGSTPVDFTGGVVEIGFASQDAPDPITFKASFHNRSGLWYLNESSVIIGKSDPIPLKYYACGTSSDMKTAMNYSYVCQSGEFRAAESSNISTGATYLALSIKNMQLQPFDFGGQFGRSSDCVCYMTVPMWMALFFILTFVFFVYFALSTISVIEGPTKFPDSQSKMIAVPLEGR